MPLSIGRISLPLPLPCRNLRSSLRKPSQESRAATTVTMAAPPARTANARSRELGVRVLDQRYRADLNVTGSIVP